jgi:hypothetical protein
MIKMFVPPAAQKYLDELLHPESGEIPGFADMLDFCNEMKAEERKFKAGSPTMDWRASQRHLFLSQPNFNNYYKYLKGQTRLIKLLSTAAGMGEVYTILDKGLDTDTQLCKFLAAALWARHDYSKHEDNEQRGQELAEEIAFVSENLANLIREFHSLELENSPAEFLNLRALLRNTDECEENRIRFNVWEQVKPIVLGPGGQEEDKRGASNIEWKSNPITEVMHEDYIHMQKNFQAVVDEFNKIQSELDFAWASAPRLPVLLSTLAKLASGYQPRRYGLIAAATNSRNRQVPKTPYIRGFGYLLSEVYGIPLTTKKIFKAIAITATVVLSDLDIEVSEATVRNQLKKPKGGKEDQCSEWHNLQFSGINQPNMLTQILLVFCTIHPIFFSRNLHISINSILIMLFHSQETGQHLSIDCAWFLPGSTAGLFVLNADYRA